MTANPKSTIRRAIEIRCERGVELIGKGKSMRLVITSDTHGRHDLMALRRNV